ncbi:MAG TPA: EamA family transporter [Bryobacteraceae bacterium]|jgi:drug/metabolite transporter (DMT)-like permease|nr:EamA family transporter [Bryobacteraceae bacterium]
MRWILLSVVVLSAVVGDLLQSYEMKEEGEQSGSAPGLIRVLRLVVSRRYLILAIASMAVSFFAFLALLQTEPLSFAVPASAASFILETALAKLVLGERVTLRRGAGVLLVFGGILLVSR